MQSTQMIFYFEDPIAFLNSHFREKQKKNPKFSLRAWARQMGYQNPSLLFQVLRGERRLKMDLAMKLATNMQLKGKALRYFELIVLNRTCQTEAEKRVYEAMLTKMRPKKFQELHHLSAEMFLAASDWYHWAILAMVVLPDFEPDVEWMHRRLEGDVDKRTLKAAWERLLRLRLVSQGPDGKYRRGDHENNILFIASQVPSAAIRQYHSQMIEKARAAVETQTVEERLLWGATMPIRKENLPKVAEILAEAHKQVMELEAPENGEEVYQLNSQFFRLTKANIGSTH